MVIHNNISIKEILSNNIASIPVDTRTGPDFGNLVLATFWMKDGKKYDVLYDRHGELITRHISIRALAQFFGKTFIPAKLDGLPCLVNIVNN